MLSPGRTVLGENALFHAVGEVFHPIFLIVAKALAFIYGIVPNYALAIAILTIVIMALLTPLTVKSTKGMLSMQRLAPEMKKLQQKYKGPENREQLNQEMMRLYKEHNVNPLSSCIPMFLQTPFLIILYDTIRGLTNTTTKKTYRYTHSTVIEHGKTVHKTVAHLVSTHLYAHPLYIPTTSRMYKDLVAHPGTMNSFGMNFALKPFSHHSSVGAAIPFFVFIVLAVGLQYFQMRQMNNRNPQAAQANPQMQTMQKFMPLLFAYIYFLVPAAVLVYMVVSTIIRIVTQDIIFRTGIVELPAASERTIPAKSSVTGGAKSSAKKASGTKTAAARNGSSADSAPAAKTATAGTAKKAAVRAGASTNGSARRRSAVVEDEDEDGDDGGTDGATDGAKPHPRSKDKRERKAR